MLRTRNGIPVPGDDPVLFLMDMDRMGPAAVCVYKGPELRLSLLWRGEILGGIEHPAIDGPQKLPADTGFIKLEPPGGQIPEVWQRRQLAQLCARARQETVILLLRIAIDDELEDRHAVVRVEAPVQRLGAFAAVEHLGDVREVDHLPVGGRASILEATEIDDDLSALRWPESDGIADDREGQQPPRRLRSA